MADKIRQLQKELGTIIKGKKEVTDKIIMQCWQEDMCFWKTFLVLERQPQLWHFASYGNGF